MLHRLVIRDKLENILSIIYFKILQFMQKRLKCELVFI